MQQNRNQYRACDARHGPSVGSFTPHASTNSLSKNLVFHQPARLEAAQQFKEKAAGKAAVARPGSLLTHDNDTAREAFGSAPLLAQLYSALESAAR
jgi:hypothetical protein